jgi:toxin YoeB
MSYAIEFSKEAEKSIEKYRKSNPVAAKKIKQLILELTEHPRTGTGHPEPLTEGNIITYSRRITKRDRIIYDVYDNILLIMVFKVESHYGEK